MQLAQVSTVENNTLLPCQSDRYSTGYFSEQAEIWSIKFQIICISQLSIFHVKMIS